MDLQRNSTLSFVRGLVNVAWVMSMMGVAILVVALLFALFSSSPLPGRVEFGLGWWGPGLTVTLPSEALATDLGHRAIVLVLGFTLAASPVLFVILYELRKILRNVADRTPFTLENAARIRYIGFAVLVGATIKDVRDMTVGKFIMDDVKVLGADVGIKVSLGLEIIGMGLLILLLAEIFRHGVRLQEEHDLTV